MGSTGGSLKMKTRWPRPALGTMRTVRAIHGHTFRAVSAMSQLCQEETVDVRRDGALDHEQSVGVGWGQYLDEAHSSDTHWGRYGTSAAVQVIAAEHRWGENGSPLLARDPLKDLAPVLPTALPPKMSLLKDEDYEHIVKLLFVIDAFRTEKPILDEGDVASLLENRPPASVGLLETVLQMALPNRQGWSTRPVGDRKRQTRDRILVTAYGLYVLRRYPVSIRSDARIADAWGWLAGEYLTRTSLFGQDLTALTCMALMAAPDEKARIEEVEQALNRGKRFLCARARASRKPVIDRPAFHSFTQNDGNDYLFLNPEILTALFLLNSGCPRKGRMFVLRVVAALAENIVPRNLPRGEKHEPRGFAIPGGMVGTVDQMWASRLLLAFHEACVAHPKRLRRAWTGWVSGRIFAGFIVAACVVAGTVLTGLLATTSGVGAGVAVFLLTLAQLVPRPRRDISA